MEELDQKWIRVSSILAMIPTLDSEGKWHYPMQARDQGVLQRKADLGSSVHAAIAAHCKNESLGWLDAPKNEREERYFESYLKWEKEMKLNPISTEKRFYNEAMKLTGRIDMFGSFGEDDKCYLIDFKCTVSPDPVKWPIQGALYHLLTRTELIDVEKTALFVQLDPKGDLPKVHQYIITDTLMTAAISWYNVYIFGTTPIFT